MAVHTDYDRAIVSKEYTSHLSSCRYIYISYIVCNSGDNHMEGGEVSLQPSAKYLNAMDIYLYYQGHFCVRQLLGLQKPI